MGAIICCLPVVVWGLETLCHVMSYAIRLAMVFCIFGCDVYAHLKLAILAWMECSVKMVIYSKDS